MTRTIGKLHHKGDISFWVGIFVHSFIALNDSAMQTRAVNTSANVFFFPYEHPLYPADGALVFICTSLFAIALNSF